MSQTGGKCRSFHEKKLLFVEAKGLGLGLENFIYLLIYCNKMYDYNHDNYLIWERLFTTAYSHHL